VALIGGRDESSRGWPVPSLRRVDSAMRSTAGLSELRRMVENHMLAGFSHRIWVVGEVGEPSDGDDGSLHFELVAVDDRGERLRLPCDVPAATVPELRDLLDRVHDADLDDVVTPGRVARVGGLLRYDFLAHRLALTVSALDPAATVEVLTQTRERTRERVAAGRLPTRQRGLLSTPAPVNVALVGGTDDPALIDAAQQLRNSGFALEPRVLGVPLVGVGASARLCTAVTQAAENSDVVLLVRGGGRPLSLAAFDGEDLARCVAELSVPVVTGLGGQGERTVCDEVAATVAPTASEAVALVVDRLTAAADSLHRTRDEVRAAGDDALDRARAELERAAAEVEAGSGEDAE
jgi:exodeoxyribonuclease VII large subunit